MVTTESGLVEAKDTGLKSPRSIFIAQYSVLVSVGTGIASVTYFSISGPNDTVNLIGNAINVFTLVLSSAYLATHQMTAWRYLHDSNPHRTNRLRSICLRTCAFVVIAWLINSVLGVTAAAQAPFCEASASATAEWKSIVGCRIHRASVAGSIMAVVNSCLLMYGIQNAQRPFAASLAGVHAKARSVEQNFQLCDVVSFSTFAHNAGGKSFDLTSCDPRSYHTLAIPRKPSRKHRSWLPPLGFQVADNKGHSAFTTDFPTPAISRQSTPLLPLPPNYSIPFYNHRKSSIRECKDLASQPTTRAASSIYSRSTSGSEASHQASTLTSFSSDSYENALHNQGDIMKEAFHKPDVPAVPVIPVTYRHPSHSLRNGGQPLRPGSRPEMPLPNFLLYASTEQQKRRSLLRSQTVYTDPRPSRTKTGSGSSGNEPSEFDDQPQSRQPVLRLDMNRANTMRVTRRSYENVRKDTDLDPGEDKDEHQDRNARRLSRKLVKKRQPWDTEPRSDRRKS